jgi:hypothetical protein
MSAVKLPVTVGGYTLVDNDIAEKLKGKSIFKTGSGKYPAIYINRKHVFLHNFVISTKKGLEIDHINGNKFDNRRENLRHVTKSQNQINNHKKVKTLSCYKWVYKKNRPGFEIGHMLDRKYMYIGYIHSRHIGALLADDIMFERFGRFVVLNFQKTIHRRELSDFIESTGGRIFNQNGGSLSFDPSSQNLLSVYDVKKRSYRFIPLERVICIKFAKTKYRIAG